MWKEIRNIEEDKIGAFVSELLCHYIQGVSEIVGTNFKIELLTSKQRKSQYIRNPKDTQYLMINFSRNIQ